MTNPPTNAPALLEQFIQTREHDPDKRGVLLHALEVISTPRFEVIKTERPADGAFMPNASDLIIRLTLTLGDRIYSSDGVIPYWYREDGATGYEQHLEGMLRLNLISEVADSLGTVQESDA